MELLAEFGCQIYLQKLYLIQFVKNLIANYFNIQYFNYTNFVVKMASKISEYNQSNQKNKIQIFDPNSGVQNIQPQLQQGNHLFFSKNPQVSQPQPIPQSFNVSTQQNPQKINTHYEFTSENMPKVLCHYHFDQYITLFCRHPSCLMPLCPQCVKIHSQEHQSYNTYGQFDTLENCLTESYSKVATFCNLFQEEIDQVHRFTNTSGKGFGESLERIKQCRVQAHQVVESFFDTLEKEVSAEIDKNRQFITVQSNQFQKYLTQRWKQLLSYLEKLNSTKCVKNLIKSYFQDINQDNEIYFKESKLFIKQLNSYIPQVLVDQSGLYQMNLDLAKFVTLKQVSAFQNQPPFQFYSDSKNIQPHEFIQHVGYGEDYSKYPQPPQQDQPPRQIYSQPSEFNPEVNRQPQQQPFQQSPIHPYLRTPGKDQPKNYRY